jgi:hypothetical protein
LYWQNESLTLIFKMMSNARSSLHNSIASESGGLSLLVSSNIFEKGGQRGNQERKGKSGGRGRRRTRRSPKSRDLSKISGGERENR